MAEIDIQNIANGSMNGCIVWVCDLRYKDYNDKPIRHVPPTEVMVVDNGKTRVYYSQSHFRPLNKQRMPSSKVIKPYDNTGYRSYAGEPLNVYDTKEECVYKYQMLLDSAISGINGLANNINVKLKDLEKLKEDYL